jgi:hypothetical protein
MTFRTEFYRNGEMVGRVLSFGTLDDAIRATNGGMIKHNAVGSPYFGRRQ